MHVVDTCMNHMHEPVHESIIDALQGLETPIGSVLTSGSYCILLRE